MLGSETLIYMVLLVFPAAMALAAAIDLVSMTIPNRISLVLVGAFFVAAVLVGLPLETIALHLLVGMLTLIVTFTLFAFNTIGGGDAKLLPAATLWLGLAPLSEFLIYTGLLGGLLSIALVLYRAILPPTFLIGQDWALRLHQKTCGVPYGLAIGGAALIVFPSTVWFKAVAAL
ncbi:MAG: prepilin peptidase [Hyphomicrobiaceae bacterium]